MSSRGYLKRKNYFNSKDFIIPFNAIYPGRKVFCLIDYLVASVLRNLDLVFDIPMFQVIKEADD
jgi:hypothetical protein